MSEEKRPRSNRAQDRTEQRLDELMWQINDLRAYVTRLSEKIDAVQELATPVKAPSPKFGEFKGGDRG